MRIVSVCCGLTVRSTYPGGALLPGTVGILGEPRPQHSMSKDDRLKCFLDLFAINLAGQADCDALVETAGALVAIGSILEVQILNGRQREAGTGDCTGASNRLLLRGVGKLRSLCQCFDGVGLDDVLETDCQTLLSGFGNHGHAGDTVTTC